MAKLCLKKTSKRMTCSMRYKIEKKVRDHHRKLKRENKKKHNKISRKPIQIPNICPFKENILAEVEALKKHNEEEKERRREEMRELRMQQKELVTENGLEGLVVNAEERQLKHDSTGVNVGIGAGLFTDNTAKTFYKEFKKVVNAADVILEVLDARDPLGTRCSTVEKEVLQNAGKKLVIVLNKADLVPREVLDAWLKYLRRSFPVVPFKASTQQQGKRLSQGRGRKGKMAPSLTQAEMEGSPCVGAELLLSLLANYCRNKDMKTAITVGVVGLPNVGKSSLINSLKRSRACNVGALPGITKNMQQVQLDSRVKLLDSPGIVFASGDMSDASIALKNALRLDHLQDVFTPASAILQRANKNQLKEIYNIEEDFTTPDQFLALMAKSMGRYKKGGVAHTNAAARCLIQDWNMGKIKYYTQPPEDTSNIVSHVSAEIVSEHAKEFNIEELSKLEKSAMSDLRKIAPDQGMAIETDGPVEAMANKSQIEVDQSETTEQDEEDEESMEDEAEAPEEGKSSTLISKGVKVASGRGRRKKGKVSDKLKKIDPTMSLEGNLRTGKVKKLQFKKNKKLQGRLAKKLKKMNAADMTS